MRPIIIFYNPKSGRFSNKKLRKICSVFDAHFQACTQISDIHELGNIRDSHIVAVGGDGTFHVAINNANLQSNTFSLLAAGSGNDFVSSFKKSNIHNLIEKIKANQIFHCDLINANGIYAHTITGIGFEALVSKKANESRNLIPALKFILPVFKYMFTFKPIQVEIVSVEFQYSGKVFMASMGNGKRAGGGFKLFPKAQLNDGKLDLLLIFEPNFWQKLLYVGLVNFGLHLHLNIIEYRQLSAVNISFLNTEYLNADGDVYEANNLTVKVEKELLKVIQ